MQDGHKGMQIDQAMDKKDRINIADGPEESKKERYQVEKCELRQENSCTGSYA